MNVISICGAAAAVACLAWGAQAQQEPYNPPSSYGYYGQGQPDYQNQPQYPQAQYPNDNAQAYQNYSQSYQNYNNAMSAYDAAQDSAAQQRSDYDNNVANYHERERAYRRRLHEYNEARAVYDEEYGPGAYARYYGPPPVAPYPY